MTLAHSNTIVWFRPKNNTNANTLPILVSNFNHHIIPDFNIWVFYGHRYLCKTQTIPSSGHVGSIWTFATLLDQYSNFYIPFPHDVTLSYYRTVTFVRPLNAKCLALSVHAWCALLGRNNYYFPYVTR